LLPIDAIAKAVPVRNVETLQPKGMERIIAGHRSSTGQSGHYASGA
jgi:hypothetical protein